jgi:hypothetical protein
MGTLRPRSGGNGAGGCAGPGAVVTRILRRYGRAAAVAALVLSPPAALTAYTAYAPTGPAGPVGTLAQRAPAAASAETVPGSAPGSPDTGGAALDPSASATQGQDADAGPGTPPRELIVPDMAAVVPGGASPAQVTALGKLHGVRAVLAVAGGQVSVGGQALNVLGVPLPAFRSWTPPVTAAATGIWAAALDGPNMVITSGTTADPRLALGSTYQVQGTTAVAVSVTATAPLDIPGIDAIVTGRTGTELGLTPAAVILVNAPGADYAALAGQIREVLGTDTTVTTLVQVTQTTALPVTGAATAGRPDTWLGLYQDSAALYCPGLSWTVLAAIGEIESGDGANDGPSTAGAVGPMQFMPGTWAAWATAGFGDSGPPDIMNPFDAVPSAARLLCADGATTGPAGLSAAIYDYNHATWYVSEVLNLAAEYAAEYP